MATLQPYKKYNAIAYDYATQLPDGWQLLPNIAIFEERKERGTENEETLSISSRRGIVKSSDYENRKDRTSDDKSQYLLVKEGDLAYNTMLMWDGAVGHSDFRGIVSPAYTVLKAKMEINPKFFIIKCELNFIKTIQDVFLTELWMPDYVCITFTSNECIALFLPYPFKTALWPT